MSRQSCAAFYLILIIYSAFLSCETSSSSILNLFKRTEGQREEDTGAESVGTRTEVAQAAVSQNGTVEGSSSSSSGSTERATSSHGKKKEKTTKDKKEKELAIIGRAGGGWGWGTSGWGHHDPNLDLFSLLGGLSFASLLGAAILYLTRNRSSGATVVMMPASSSSSSSNSTRIITGRRRRRDLPDLVEVDPSSGGSIGGESVVEFLEKLAIHLTNPSWERRQKEEPEKVVPFHLE